MVRRPRLCPVGIPQHIIQRGNNRQICFGSEQDFAAFAGWLFDYSRQFHVCIHAWIFMTNHVHLLVTPHQENSVSLMMQAVGRRYVRYFNREYRRSGTLWEGRYKSTLVDADSYLLTVYRYIELNPVRAGMVTHTSEYPWSSYQGNAMGQSIQLLTPHPLYRQLGKSDAARQSAYRALFRGRMSERDLVAIREATNKAWVLGDDRFKAQIEARTGRRSAPLGRGGDRKSVAFREGQNQ